jgi:chromosome segregation ATPase
MYFKKFWLFAVMIDKEGNLKISELEQKYNNLETRMSKVEACLRDANRRREGLHGTIEKLKKETLSRTDALKELRG